MKKIDKIKEYLKEENDKVIVTNGYIEVIFPEYYFEKKMANKLLPWKKLLKHLVYLIL